MVLVSDIAIFKCLAMEHDPNTWVLKRHDYRSTYFRQLSRNSMYCLGDNETVTGPVRFVNEA